MFEILVQIIVIHQWQNSENKSNRYDTTRVESATVFFQFENFLEYFDNVQYENNGSPYVMQFLYRVISFTQLIFIGIV